MCRLKRSVGFCICIISLLSASFLPQKAKASPFPLLDTLIQQGLSQVQGIQNYLQDFISGAQGFYENPTLGGILELPDYLQAIDEQFSSIDQNFSEFGSYGDCIGGDLSACFSRTSQLNHVAFRKAALIFPQSDPFSDLLQTMNAIAEQPEVGEQHPVIIQYFRFAGSLNDAQEVAGAHTLYSNKVSGLKTKVRQLKMRFKLGQISKNALQKAKAKLSKAKVSLSKAQDQLEQIKLDDPVMRELMKLQDELVKLRDGAFNS